MKKGTACGTFTLLGVMWMLLLGLLSMLLAAFMAMLPVSRPTLLAAWGSAVRGGLLTALRSMLLASLTLMRLALLAACSPVLLAVLGLAARGLRPMLRWLLLRALDHQCSMLVAWALWFLAELAVDKRAHTLLMPVAARRGLSDLPDDIRTKVNIEFYQEPADGVFKCLAGE